MITLAKAGRWISTSRWRLYPLFTLLMVLPIVFFAYSAGQVLRHQTETEADHRERADCTCVGKFGGGALPSEHRFP